MNRPPARTMATWCGELIRGQRAWAASPSLKGHRQPRGLTLSIYAHLMQGNQGSLPCIGWDLMLTGAG